MLCPQVHNPAALIGRAPRRRRGLTLAECIVALVVLSIAVTAVAYAVTAGQMQAAEALRQSRAAMLAEALMDEIFSKSYGAPAGGTQPARTSFTTAGKYNVFDEAPGNLKNAAGVLYPTEFQCFGRAADVANGSITLPGLGAGSSGLVITVRVTLGGQTVTTLTRFMVNPA